MKHRFLSLFLSAILVFSLIPTIPAEASGTTDWENMTAFENNGVYYISSADDLRAMRDLVNQVGSNNSCKFYLTTDIVLNDPDWFTYSNGFISAPKSEYSTLVEKWIPIGSGYSTPFLGTFDGQGHTISGIYCSGSSYNENLVGLFGYMAGTIIDLNVNNSYIVTQKNDTTGSAGGIAMTMANTSGGSPKIINCSFKGYVRSVYQQAGGIVGQMAYGTIDGCFVNAGVRGTDAGGIAGSIRNYNTVIQNSFSSGTVTAVSNNSRVGGIVGSCNINGSVINCGSISELDGAAYGYGDVGGICGIMYNYTTVENCWFAGSIGSNCGYAAGIAVIAENSAGNASVLNSYCSYGSATFLYQLNTALQSDITKTETGCGKFSTYDTEGRSALTITTTDYSGSIGYWTGEAENQVYHRCGDSDYVLTEQTDIVTGLNNWVAANNNTDGTLYRMWCSGPDLLPQLMENEWSETPEIELTEIGNTIYIDSAHELAQFAKNVNSGERYRGKTVYLTANIDLDGKYWTPIGNVTHPFYGTFDGNGYRISGMRVRGSDDNHGLFGYVIGNLVNIHLDRSTVQGGMHCGGIVGHCGQSTVDRCSFEGAVYGTTTVGGIAGSADIAIINSRNLGIVRGTGDVGAIAGFAEMVGNCFNSGRVIPISANFVFYSGVSPLSEGIDLSGYQGSIVGIGTADNCYDAQTVTDSSVANQLLTALSARAKTDEAYLDWTVSGIANSSLPYYAAFSGGSGSEEDPYLITSVEQLAYLAAIVNSEDKQEGVYYRLEADLVINEGTFDSQGNWLDGNGKTKQGSPTIWEAISDFYGYFDGNGHLISGLYGSALFEELDEGTVINLMLVNGYIFGDGVIWGNGSVINCASTCLGRGAALSGQNCWDTTDAIPSVAALNSYEGGAYSRWYASPTSPYPSFLPSYVAVNYQLGGGQLSDGPNRFIYGEALSLAEIPSKNGFDFAGWTVSADDSSIPTRVCWKGDSTVLPAVNSVTLSACWAESGKTFLEYCDVVNGIYRLASDVVLSEGTVLNEDMVLDLNGHTITGYSQSALFYANGVSLTVINSAASDGLIRTNAAVFGGNGGQILLPGSANTETSTVSIPAGTAQEYTLTVFALDGSAPYAAFLAFYDANGQMRRIENLTSINGIATTTLTGETVSSWSKIRGFVIPADLFN